MQIKKKLTRISGDPELYIFCDRCNYTFVIEENKENVPSNFGK